MNPAIRQRFNLLRAIVLFFMVAAAKAADFTVVAPGYYYNINGEEPNPILTLERGRTYTFDIDTTSAHPFYIDSPGVVNNNISLGTITYTVPTDDTVTTYYYFCSEHGFGAQIITVPPSNAPPNIQIVSLAVSTNISLKFTGTNTLTLIPEYATNLNLPNWSALNIQTNRFVNGTNEAICGRPPGDTVFFRIRVQ